MKIFVRTISIVLGLIVTGLAFVFFSPIYNLYVVRSGSMAPAINTSDVVITGPVSAAGSIKPGVIVTYELGIELVTHRVVSINGDTLITKGDANEDPDSNPVRLSQVKGSYLFKIPYVGYFTSFVRTRVGWFLAIIVPAIALAGFIVKDIVKEVLNNEKHNKAILKTHKTVNLTKRTDPLKAILIDSLYGYSFPEMKVVDGKMKQKMTKSTKH